MCSYKLAVRSTISYLYLHKKVLMWADENGVPAVDMLRHMKSKNKNKEYRIEGDGHPNGRAFTETAQVIAPIIYEFLEGSTP
jgi:hypothetical protein